MWRITWRGIRRAMARATIPSRAIRATRGSRLIPRPIGTTRNTTGVLVRIVHIHQLAVLGVSSASTAAFLSKLGAVPNRRDIAPIAALSSNRTVSSAHCSACEGIRSVALHTVRLNA
eukprot:Skav234503  [mRNA]  locus=scaffold1613:46559:47141:- [translate_table: standard]